MKGSHSQQRSSSMVICHPNIFVVLHAICALDALFDLGFHLHPLFDSPTTTVANWNLPPSSILSPNDVAWVVFQWDGHNPCAACTASDGFLLLAVARPSRAHTSLWRTHASNLGRGRAAAPEEGTRSSNNVPPTETKYAGLKSDGDPSTTQI
jgi:hypothetical protein